MRFYELGSKLGIEKNDVDHLIALANQDGFDVKSNLKEVDAAMLAWIEKNPDDLLRRLEQEKEAKKAAPVVKKRVPAPKKAAAKKEDSAPAPEPEQSAPAAAEPAPPAPAPQPIQMRQMPGRPGMPKPQPAPAPVAPAPAPAAAPAAVEQPAPAPAPAAPVAPVAPVAPAVKPQSAPAAETARKSAAPAPAAAQNLVDNRKKVQYQPAKQPPKKDKAQAKEIKVARPPVTPMPAAESSLVIDSEAPVEPHVIHKHKRADFKGTLSRPELPAIFSSLDSEYTRSIRTTGLRSRGAKVFNQAAPQQGGGRRRGGGNKRGQMQVVQQRDPNAEAELIKAMSLRDLSVALGVKLNSIMSFLMQQGKLLAVNDILGEEDIVQIAQEFKIPYVWKQEEDLEQQLKDELEEQEQESIENKLKPRPPVVTFMGHVDHGKTSLLDKIRETRVAEGEAGGITQHIGAYSVEKNGHRITFLDTPGHEAFTQMRARGANITDVAVLVVAADDGVMPQTKEAYSHAKNAGVPVVVAINKCDLNSANPDKVRQELATQLELMPEEWGGNTGMIDVSAMTGNGIDNLLERILLEAEMLELKANPARNALGYVIESEMTENRGVVATVLVLDGTLHRGDIILTSNGYGKVKLMYDWNGRTTDTGGPSQAVSVVGLNNVPEVGDKIFVVEDMIKARKLAEERENNARAQALARQKRKHVTLESLTSYLQEEEKRTLNIIIKADVSGSLEVLEKTLNDLSTDEVALNVIHSGVGGISQADVILADASDALIVGFHVVADSSAKLQATSHGVQIKVYHIIYRLIEDMKAALEGMLPPEEKEVIRGHIEVREVFRSSKLGNIAGCYVTDGLVNRNCHVRLIRDNVVIYTNALESLRRVKDDVKEVRSGFECGLRIVGYDDIRTGDVLEAYEIEEVARKLD